MTLSRLNPHAGILADAVAANGFVFTAGQVADDPSQDIRGQTKQVLAQIDKALAHFGTDKSKIVSASIWLSDIRNREAMNEIWKAWVDANNLPARATVEAKLADPRMLVEIAVVAVK